jgi:hypothetical protein
MLKGGGVGDAEKGSWKEMIPGMDAISGGRKYRSWCTLPDSGRQHRKGAGYGKPCSFRLAIHAVYCLLMKPSCSQVGIGNYMKNSPVIDGTIRLFFLVETFEQLRTIVTSIFNSICSMCYSSFLANSLTNFY